MTGGLKITAPGVHTTVQDFGRVGYQDMGVPVSGALDPESLRLANVLVGNSRTMAGLEALYQGPTMEVSVDSLRIALGGYGASIDVLGPEPARIAPWRSIVLKRGQIFRVALDGTTSSCYLAIAGGFDLEPCLGSLSTYSRAGLGGFQGRALIAGDELPLVLSSAADGEDVRLPKPEANSLQRPIRITWGMQSDSFTDESRARFVTESFSILRESDRMGYRIAGPKIEHQSGYDIVSDGIATGAIQVPGDGQPIVLLADHQTTGGYPKIATVISADLPALGRRIPDQEIRFEAIEVEEAERIRRNREKALCRLEASMERLTGETKLDLDALYASNLISGVVGNEG
ncbi:MAG: biotin-dependent carboxyltransferase family protein [Alphaproteobacteria bacterium]|nr:biotin-dependent carboxyltransferase family protein [Alphaproteobacteria bacterium]